MAEQTENLTKPPELAVTLMGSVSRHAGTYLAGLLAGVGAISHDETGQAATLVASIVLWGAMQLWSVIEKSRRAGPA